MRAAPTCSREELDTRLEFNELPTAERFRMGRYMDLERIVQLRRDRAKVIDMLEAIDAEILRVQQWMVERRTTVGPAGGEATDGGNTK